jgi:hypothetical protein
MPQVTSNKPDCREQEKGRRWVCLGVDFSRHTLAFRHYRYPAELRRFPRAARQSAKS